MCCLFVVMGNIRCSVCDSSKGNEDCVTHPPAAQLCEGYDYCIAVAKYTNDGNLPLRTSLVYSRITTNHATVKLRYI